MKSAAFGGALKLENYISTPQSLSLRGVVTHDQVFCLSVPIVYMEFDCVVSLTFDVSTQYVLQNIFVSFMLRIRVMAITF